MPIRFDIAHNPVRVINYFSLLCFFLNFINSYLLLTFINSYFFLAECMRAASCVLGRRKRRGRQGIRGGERKGGWVFSSGSVAGEEYSLGLVCPAQTTNPKPQPCDFQPLLLDTIHFNRACQPHDFDRTKSGRANFDPKNSTPRNFKPNTQRDFGPVEPADFNPHFDPDPNLTILSMWGRTSYKAVFGGIHLGTSYRT
jgi:hypothetical protein